MANDERAERAARNIVAGIVDGGCNLGLVAKPEGISALTTAIIEAIENEYSPSSALVDEVAEKITNMADFDLGEAQFHRDVIEVLADFKRAIELSHYGTAMVAEPELAVLIGEAKDKTDWTAQLASACCKSSQR